MSSVCILLFLFMLGCAPANLPVQDDCDAFYRKQAYAELEKVFGPVQQLKEETDHYLFSLLLIPDSTEMIDIKTLKNEAGRKYYLKARQIQRMPGRILVISKREKGIAFYLGEYAYSEGGIAKISLHHDLPALCD
jgi:hypothetical protein